MSDEFYDELQTTSRIAAVTMATVVVLICSNLMCMASYLDFRDWVKSRLCNSTFIRGERGLVGPQGPIGPQGPMGEQGPRGTIDRTADRGWIMDLIREQTLIDIKAEIQSQFEVRDMYRPGNVLSFGEPSAPPAYPGKE